MSAFTDLFNAQKAILLSDIRNEALPILQKAANLLASNPTRLNLIAQAMSVVAQLQALAPGVAQDELKALTAWVNTELQDLANPPPANK